ncbi:hypothetical protein FRB90_006129 [Tulasnella sp. 427]|nr:hypothetical protein FRB90_006129 [Tulasnella sp. 427]
MSSSLNTYRAPDIPLNASFLSSNHPQNGPPPSQQFQNQFRLPPIQTLSFPQSPGSPSLMALSRGRTGGLRLSPSPAPVNATDGWNTSNASTPLAPPSGSPAEEIMREQSAPSVAGCLNSDCVGHFSLRQVSLCADRSFTLAPFERPLPPPPTPALTLHSVWPYHQQFLSPPTAHVETVAASSTGQSYVAGQKRPHPTSAKQQPHASGPPNPPPHHSSSSQYYHYRASSSTGSAFSRSEPYYSGPPPSQQPPRPITPYDAQTSSTPLHSFQQLLSPRPAPSASSYAHQDRPARSHRHYPSSQGPPMHQPAPPTDYYGVQTTRYQYSPWPPVFSHHSHTRQQPPPTPRSYGKLLPSQRPHYPSSGSQSSSAGSALPRNSGPQASTGAHTQRLSPAQQNHTASEWATTASAPLLRPGFSARPLTNAGPDKPIAQLVEHGQRLIAFAKHYATPQRQSPLPYQLPEPYETNHHSYPQPHEIREMTARAEAAVVLLIQLGEEAKPYRKLQAQQREHENQLRKIGDSRSNVNAPTGAGKATYKDLTERKRAIFGGNTEALEQAEKDSAIIARKRLLSQRGVLSRSKTKCQKKCSRAASSGKCHSCLTTETSQWRRGPDGVRTLCNKCGLHYAVMTERQARSSVAYVMLQSFAEHNAIGVHPQSLGEPAPISPSGRGPNEPRQEVEEHGVESATAVGYNTHDRTQSCGYGELQEAVGVSDEEDKGSEDGDDHDNDRMHCERSPMLPFGVPSSTRPDRTSYISNGPTSGWGRSSSLIHSSSGGAGPPIEDYRPLSLTSGS